MQVRLCIALLTGCASEEPLVPFDVNPLVDDYLDSIELVEPVLVDCGFARQMGPGNYNSWDQEQCAHEATRTHSNFMVRWKLVDIEGGGFDRAFVGATTTEGWSVQFFESTWQYNFFGPRRSAVNADEPCLPATRDVTECNPTERLCFVCE